MRFVTSAMKQSISLFYTEALNLLWNFYPSPISIKVYPGNKFKFVKQGAITKILFLSQHLIPYKKSFEYHTLEKFIESLKPEMLVLDIGANIGLFSLVGSNKVQKIIAFEPSQEISSILDENLKINKISNVKVEKIALSNKEGFINLVKPNNDIGDLLSFIDESNIENGEKVKMKTLDNYLEENEIKKVDLIKIDIEGAELMCFEGAKNLLSSEDGPIIIFECNEQVNNSRYNYRTQDLFKLLFDFGYEIQEIERQQWIAIKRK